MVEETPRLAVEGLNLRVGAFALRDVGLRLLPGDYGVLLGPTGCGKTLLAETICGLNDPDSGMLRLDGRDATRLDPALRRIGYVPQDYALLPFRTVARNIALGLEARRMTAHDIAVKVDRLLDLLGLAHLRDRLPGRLSGGERQRTALARALAIEPDLLVLDEPLSALDEATCETLIPQMAQWHRTLKTTTLHICHRLEEALSLGTRLAVMREGRIEQCDSPDVLSHHPANAFVANFLRLPNRISGEVRETSGGRRFCIGTHALTLTDCALGPALGLFPIKDVAVTLEEPPPTVGWQVFTATVSRNAAGWAQPALSLSGEITLRLSGIFAPERWSVGRRAHVRLPETGWHILPA